MKNFTQLRTQKLVDSLGIKIDGQEVQVITRNDQMFLDKLNATPASPIKETKKPSLFSKAAKYLEVDDLVEPLSETGLKALEVVNPESLLEGVGALCRLVSGQVDMNPKGSVKGFFDKPSVAKFMGYHEETPMAVAEEVEAMEDTEEEYIMPGQDILDRVHAVNEGNRMNPFTVIKGGRE